MMLNMAYPLVSILVRSSNRPSLERSLASLTQQDYPAIEVWVVAAVVDHAPLPDGASPHNAQLVTTAVPLSRSAAANKALGLAQGQYALFLDDDDWLAPTHISRLVQALENSPEHGVAYTQTQMVDSAGEVLSATLLGMPFDRLNLLCGNWIAIHSALFSMRLPALGCRFDERLDLYEDWDFWIQASAQGDFLFVPIATAFYRIHESSGVHQKDRRLAATKLIRDKWCTRLTPQQQQDLMARNWQRVELSQQLQALEDSHATAQLALKKIGQDMEAARADMEAARAQHAQELARIVNSKSWRLTQPLRKVGALVRRTRQLLAKLYHLTLKVSRSLKHLPALLRQQGWRPLLQRLRQEWSPKYDYASWINDNEPSAKDHPILQARVQTWAHLPLVSVVMPTYNSPLKYLQEAIESVQAQLYPHWELCIADDASSVREVQAFLKDAAARDPRIVLTLRPHNGHISACSNSALASARGDWIALLDHDDRLHPLALYRVVEALQTQPNATLIYSDEDKINERGERFDPYFKSDYNRELMWAHNMISHLGCYRRQTLLDIGGFRVGFEGSQDYDLALRVIERSRSDQIVHVPRVLYHWRAITGSTALSADQKPYAETAGRKALQEHLHRQGIEATVCAAPEVPTMNRVRPPLPSPLPLVSVLIPTRDRIDLLRLCIDTLRQKSTYPHLEIIVIDNGSEHEQSLAYFKALQAQGICVIRDDRAFNYSALNNQAARMARGEYLCLMNNDIEIITPDWLEEMLAFAALPEVGAVGTRLWYPNGQGLQHAGVVIGLGGVAGHAHSKLGRHQPGYFGRAALHHRLMAVTAACLLVRKQHFMAIDGLDERLAVAFNDVDFCLRLSQAGLACVYTPYAEMIHHESATRGDDMSGPKKERFLSEVAFMQERWKDLLSNDPFYSPNLSLSHADFRPAPVSRLPKL